MLASRPKGPVDRERVQRQGGESGAQLARPEPAEQRAADEGRPPIGLGIARCGVAAVAAGDRDHRLVGERERLLEEVEELIGPGIGARGDLARVRRRLLDPHPPGAQQVVDRHALAGATLTGPTQHLRPPADVRIGAVHPHPDEQLDRRADLLALLLERHPREARHLGPRSRVFSCSSTHEVETGGPIRARSGTGQTGRPARNTARVSGTPGR